MSLQNDLHEPKRSWETYAEVCQRQHRRMKITSTLLLIFALVGMLCLMAPLWMGYGK